MLPNPMSHSGTIHCIMAAGIIRVITGMVTVPITGVAGIMVGVDMVARAMRREAMRAEQGTAAAGMAEQAATADLRAHT